MELVISEIEKKEQLIRNSFEKFKNLDVKIVANEYENTITSKAVVCVHCNKPYFRYSGLIHIEDQTCPHCNEKQEWVVDIPSNLIKELAQSFEDGPIVEK